MRIKSLLTSILFSLCCLAAYSQELNCNVEINSDKVQTTNKSVFNTLQNAITDYLNENHFTNAQFSTNERIECRMFFTIAEHNAETNTFTGDLQVQSSRPVYNSTYTTTLLNFKDTKIEFTYQENEPLVFSHTSMESQLTAILNFYAYLIIAIDFDSFSPRGGQEYFDLCANVVQMAQSSGETGWKAFEDTKNRSAVLSSYTDPSTNAIRDLLYTYHRTGLDEMVLSPDKGRAAITSTLDIIQKVHQANSMSVALSIFKDAKLDELVNIYTKGTTDERKKAYEILSPIYPTEMTRINMIKDGRNE